MKYICMTKKHDARSLIKETVMNIVVIYDNLPKEVIARFAIKYMLL